MQIKPYQSALLAAGYISLLVLVIYYGTYFFDNGPDTVLIPIAMLSLLVFSVSVMAYLFFYEPVRLLIEGKREEAINFFVRTIACFGAIAIVFFILALLSTHLSLVQ